MRNALTVKLDGEFLDGLGLGYSDPTYSSSFGEAGGGGCDEAEVVLSAPIGYRSHLLHEGAYMQVLLGSYPMFTGDVDGIDRDTWTIHASGLAKQAARVGALDASYETSTVVDDIIDAAQAVRGALRGWRRLSSISSVPYGASEVTDGPNYLATVLDGVGEAAGKWWTVRADGIVRLESVPTVPTYHMVPGSIDLPISYKESASRILVRYENSTLHVGTTAQALDPIAQAAFPQEVFVDATPLGEITHAEATAHAASIIAQGKAKPGYTASVELSRWQLLDDNLCPADLRRVRAGEMVRLHGVSNDLTHEGHHDFVIGRAKPSTGWQTLQIDPMGLVTNGSQEDVIAKVLAAAWNEKFKS